VMGFPQGSRRQPDRGRRPSQGLRKST
jgi:hypothetical protein